MHKKPLDETLKTSSLRV